MGKSYPEEIEDEGRLTPLVQLFQADKMEISIDNGRKGRTYTEPALAANTYERGEIESRMDKSRMKTHRPVCHSVSQLLRMSPVTHEKIALKVRLRGISVDVILKEETAA